jgi:hypothetical protein
MRGICQGFVIQLALDPTADPDSYLSGARLLDVGATASREGS